MIIDFALPVGQNIVIAFGAALAAVMLLISIRSAISR